MDELIFTENEYQDSIENSDDINSCEYKKGIAIGISMKGRGLSTVYGFGKKGLGLYVYDKNYSVILFIED